ncbi:glycosyltransferase family 2 protein [Croceicoccus sp. F390]|uniref:Glycosyltransferase family 2 protein n=1 Tax=Croceicoccus esteveae TaxID=3075597 RepID=A0ABU2ZDJ9_9SPHN|nr:glycosyltransferase family 2 protein [Croceicoccus sp. F390]MDT0574675.1 glycosyltransferase family 2 protein [Croceicoccus sp. F390]
MHHDGFITTIIAAYNAADTIGRAVKSALSQAEVAQVIVVDDASQDQTCAIAVQAAAGDERFLLLRQLVNGGPAAARNVAIAASTAPLIAILDADDCFLPNRFAGIGCDDPWDIWADNILFVTELGDTRGSAGEHHVHDSEKRHCFLDFERFVAGNISRRNHARGELGFLKPVLRREMIERLSLRYKDNCRLGEDFLFLAEALGRGAIFHLAEGCGYAALRRTNSLSSQHAAHDLRNLLDRERALMRRLTLAPAQRRIMRRHIALTAGKLAHREVLDIKREQGLAAGLLSLLRRPTAVRDILLDRFVPASGDMEWTGLLIDGPAFARLCGSGSAA